MKLLLEVISAHAGGMGSNRRKIIGSEGTRIGRNSDNDWVISDPYISRYHVTIRCLNGMYFVEGKGRNPIALNDRSRVLRNDDPHPLNDGDRLFIDEYELLASRVEDDVAHEYVVPSNSPEQAFEGEPQSPNPPSTHVDPLIILGGGKPGVRTEPLREASPAPHASDPIEGRSYRPPPIVTPAGESSSSLREDWYSDTPTRAPTDGNQGPRRTATDESINRTPGTVGRERPQPAAEPARDNSKANPAPPAARDALASILAGAGLDPNQAQLSPEMVQQLGAVLRIVVQGTMDVLKARNEIRNQFRMPLTQIARSDNNPLKFSADAQDALYNLLVKQSGAFLGPQGAFTDAFEDIRFHQLAMLKGVQAGFERMLGQLAPQTVQQRVDNAGGGALRALAGGKARLWDEYASLHAQLASDHEDAFRRLFGDEFARAYEAELRKLKTAGVTCRGTS